VHFKKSNVYAVCIFMMPIIGTSTHPVCQIVGKCKLIGHWQTWMKRLMKQFVNILSTNETL